MAAILSRPQCVKGRVILHQNDVMACKLFPSCRTFVRGSTSQRWANNCTHPPNCRTTTQCIPWVDNMSPTSNHPRRCLYALGQTSAIMWWAWLSQKKTYTEGSHPTSHIRRGHIPQAIYEGVTSHNSPVTVELPAQKASNAENVSIWRRHHVISTPGSTCCVSQFMIAAESVWKLKKISWTWQT